MSWPLVLASYPRSVLRDRLPLTLLALIEKWGLVVEDQLLAEIGTEDWRAKEALFDLRLNDLIEYGSHHLRLTDRGKMLVRRFDLDSEIRQAVLDLLRIEPEQRDHFDAALRAYRDGAYKYYSNTLCSMWTWRELAGAVLGAQPPPLDAEVLAGMRSLIARDVGEWWRSATANQTAASYPRSVREGCLLVSDTLRHWETAEGTAGRLIRASRLMSSNLEISGAAEARAEEATPLLTVFWTFTRFRADSEPDLWFDQWAEFKEYLPMRRGRQSPLKYAEQIQSHLAQHLERRGRSTYFRLAPAAFQAGKLAERFFGQLLVAESLSELAELTGLSEEDLVGVIRDIAERCEALVGPGSEEE